MPCACAGRQQARLTANYQLNSSTDSKEKEKKRKEKKEKKKQQEKERKARIAKHDNKKSKKH